MYITIKIVGSYGQLDVAEGEYTVTNIEDIALRARDIIYEYGRCYPNYGWSIAWGNKDNLSARKRKGLILRFIDKLRKKVA